MKDDYFPKQFVIYEKETSIPVGWLRSRFYSIYIYRSSHLPLTKIFIDESYAAICLGWFTFDGFFYNFDSSIKFNTNELYKQNEKYFCGRFILIDFDKNDIIIRTDSGGQLPIVYSLENNIAGSTTSVISQFINVEKDSLIHKNISRLDNTIWYPFGILPYKSIKRLLPYQKFEFYKKSITNVPYDIKRVNFQDSKILTKKIFSDVVNNIKSIAFNCKIKSHLTAGYDSRMVFSACRFSNVDCSYLTIKDKRKFCLDCITAINICKKYYCNHEIIDYIEPNKREIDEWLYRTGNIVYDMVTKLCKTVQLNDSEYYILTGSCGEVGRAFYWSESDLEKSNISPKEIIQKLGFVYNDYLDSQYEIWYHSLPIIYDIPTLLDLLYISNRLACWAGPSVYGHDISTPTFSPFNQNSIYTEMLSTSNVYRYKQLFAFDFISQYDKKLATYNFNRASGLNKILFIKQELKAILPKEIYKKIKIIKKNISKI